MLDKVERDRSLAAIREVALKLTNLEYRRFADALLKASDILERETESCKFNCRCKCNKGERS